MLIFSSKGTITPLQDKTNIALDFAVPKGTQWLKISFEYNPKTVEDKKTANALIFAGMKKYDVDLRNIEDFMPVKNLITLSFDENGKYRGACHRQPNKQTIIIAEKDSTFGILNRPVENGEWQIVLNVHFAGCPVDYSIDIEAGGAI